MARPQRSPPPPCHDTTLPPRRTLSSVCHKVVRHVPLCHAHHDFSPPNSQNPDAPRSNSCSQANPLHQTWVPAHPYQLTTRQEFPSESSTVNRSCFPLVSTLHLPAVGSSSKHISKEAAFSFSLVCDTHTCKTLSCIITCSATALPLSLSRPYQRLC